MSLVKPSMSMVGMLCIGSVLHRGNSPISLNDIDEPSIGGYHRRLGSAAPLELNADCFIFT
jgi:hypothetical protein